MMPKPTPRKKPPFPPPNTLTKHPQAHTNHGRQSQSIQIQKQRQSLFNDFYISNTRYICILCTLLVATEYEYLCVEPCSCICSRTACIDGFASLRWASYLGDMQLPPLHPAPPLHEQRMYLFLFADSSSRAAEQKTRPDQANDDCESRAPSRAEPSQVKHTIFARIYVSLYLEARVAVRSAYASTLVRQYASLQTST